MKLYYTPLSHFSRKVRIIQEFYGIKCDLIDIGNVASLDQENFPINPLFQVPVLVDNDKWIIDSENIVQYLIRLKNSQDNFEVRTTDINLLNLRSVLNGIMENDVKITLAKRTGVPVDNYLYFLKAIKSIEASLLWLETNHIIFSDCKVRYEEILLICTLDHLKYFEVVDLQVYSNLLRIFDRHKKEEYFEKTDPFKLKPRSKL